MNRWESQLRTNLEDSSYVKLIGNTVASAPGLLAAGLLNLRHAEGCLRLAGGQAAGPQELAQLIALTRCLFPATDGTAELPAFIQLKPVESGYFTSDHERLFVQQLPDNRVLVACLPAAVPLGPAFVVIADLAKSLRANSGRTLASLLRNSSDVLAAALLDVPSRQFSDVFRRAEVASEFALDLDCAHALARLFGTEAAAPLAFKRPSGESLALVHACIAGTEDVRNWWTMPHDPEHVAFVLASPSTLQGLVSNVAKRLTDDTLRLWVDGLLAWGIEVGAEYDSRVIIERLRELPGHDLIGRLHVAAFSNHGVGDGETTQNCKACSHYHAHRRWCDVPELHLPVEAQWHCRLWKR